MKIDYSIGYHHLTRKQTVEILSPTQKESKLETEVARMHFELILQNPPQSKKYEPGLDIEFTTKTHDGNIKDLIYKFDYKGKLQKSSENNFDSKTKTWTSKQPLEISEYRQEIKNALANAPKKFQIQAFIGLHPAIREILD